MEKIEYREAEFNVIRTMSCDRTRVVDAANNYLHTHWDFTVEVNWQPALVSYSRAPGTFTPFAVHGNLPGETDLALLTRMLQPRGLLRVTAGGSVVLETPSITNLGGRAPCDVKSGPSCEMIGVPLMVGVRHWVVTLRFVADVRDVDNKTSGTNLVVSNLWVGTEDIDFQRRSTRRFAGRAILRADLMRQSGVNANQFRDLYLFRCPEHYQRQNVVARLSEDGTTLDWSFEDVMRGYDLGANSEFVEIEAYRTGVTSCGSPGKIALDSIRHAAQLATLAAVGDIASAGTSIAAGLVSSGVLGILDNLPKSYMKVRCDVTGDRNANLGRQASIALGVCITQLGIGGILPGNASIAQLLTGTAELVMRQDIGDKVFTSVEVTIKWNDSAIIAAGSLAVAYGQLQAAVPLLREGALGMISKFTTDSRTLTVPPSPGFLGGTLEVPNLVAARDNTYTENPPMTQSAFGVNPTSVPGAVPTSFSTGTIPAGIQNLIVQALLGQGETPPPARTLVRES